MAVMDLAALYEAVTLNAGPPSGPEAARWESLYAGAWAIIDRYAPEAPEGVKNEALVRFAGYAADVQGVTKEAIGEQSVEYTDRTSPAVFRRSGAMGLLSPWKRRRAGRIG